MHKHKNFIARLLNRGAAADKKSPDIDPQEQIIVILSDDEQPVTTSSDEAFGRDETEEPTICKDGKLFRARLRSGRWETFGAPIGDC